MPSLNGVTGPGVMGPGMPGFMGGVPSLSITPDKFAALVGIAQAEFGAKPDDLSYGEWAQGLMGVVDSVIGRSLIGQAIPGKAAQYGNDIIGTITATSQYSPVEDGRFAQALADPNPEVAAVVAAFLGGLQNGTLSITSNTHFANTTNPTVTANWTKGTPAITIGVPQVADEQAYQHSFFDNVDNVAMPTAFTMSISPDLQGMVMASMLSPDVADLIGMAPNANFAEVNPDAISVIADPNVDSGIALANTMSFETPAFAETALTTPEAALFSPVPMSKGLANSFVGITGPAPAPAIQGPEVSIVSSAPATSDPGVQSPEADWGWAATNAAVAHGFQPDQLGSFDTATVSQSEPQGFTNSMSATPATALGADLGAMLGADVSLSGPTATSGMFSAEPAATWGGDLSGMGDLAGVAPDPGVSISALGYGGTADPSAVGGTAFGSVLGSDPGVDPGVSVSAMGYGGTAAAPTAMGYGSFDSGADPGLSAIGKAGMAVSTDPGLSSFSGDPAAALGFTAADVATSMASDPFGTSDAFSAAPTAYGGEPATAFGSATDEGGMFGGFPSMSDAEKGAFVDAVDGIATSLEAGVTPSISEPQMGQFFDAVSDFSIADDTISPVSVTTTSVTPDAPAIAAPAVATTSNIGSTPAAAVSSAPAATSTAAAPAAAPASTSDADDGKSGGLFGGGNIGGVLGGAVGSVLGGPVGGIIGSLAGKAIGSAISGQQFGSVLGGTAQAAPAPASVLGFGSGLGGTSGAPGGGYAAPGTTAASGGLSHGDPAGLGLGPGGNLF